MSNRVDRRRTIRQHDLAHEGFEIGFVFAEAFDVTLVRIAQRPLRKSLPAPVERRHRKAAGAQFARGLVIFLDELGTPLKDADRALAARWRRPAREPQFDAVRRLQSAGDNSSGTGLAGMEISFMKGTAGRSAAL